MQGQTIIPWVDSAYSVTGGVMMSALKRIIEVVLALIGYREGRSIEPYPKKKKGVYAGRFCADCGTFISSAEFSCPKCGGCL